MLNIFAWTPGNKHVTYHTQLANVVNQSTPELEPTSHSCDEPNV